METFASVIIRYVEALQSKLLRANCNQSININACTVRLPRHQTNVCPLCNQRCLSAKAWSQVIGEGSAVTWTHAGLKGTVRSPGCEF